jgi:hypothetical protein
MTYRVKDWTKFQHFKDRRPPWIKLYRDILDNRDIAMISRPGKGSSRAPRTSPSGSESKRQALSSA